MQGTQFKQMRFDDSVDKIMLGKKFIDLYDNQKELIGKGWNSSGLTPLQELWPRHSGKTVTLLILLCSFLSEDIDTVLIVPTASRAQYLSEMYGVPRDNLFGCCEHLRGRKDPLIVLADDYHFFLDSVQLCRRKDHPSRCKIGYELINEYPSIGLSSKICKDYL